MRLRYAAPVLAPLLLGGHDVWPAPGTTSRYALTDLGRKATYSFFVIAVHTSGLESASAWVTVTASR